MEAWVSLNKMIVNDRHIIQKGSLPTAGFSPPEVCNHRKVSKDNRMEQVQLAIVNLTFSAGGSFGESRFLSSKVQDLGELPPAQGIVLI